MRNKNIILLIISILFLACTHTESTKDTSIINFDSGFSLYQDTIYVDIKGEMTHALKYQDKHYILFEQRVLKYGGSGKRWVYIFSDGQLEKVIDCTKEMGRGYLDFYVKNDTIILKPYMDDQSYQLDLKNSSWIKVDNTDDLIFEDENYQVQSLDFGEWGGKTWFIDKKTGQEYILEVKTPLVNKIGTTYYLTNPFSVLKIENPLLLNKCHDDITYENIRSTQKFYTWYGDPIGYEIIYQDTTHDYFDSNYSPHIVSSFVLDNELLHIYETDSATYIARAESNSIKPIQKIIENIRFYNWYYSYRCRNINGDNELLKFKIKDEKVFGLLEIVGSKIHVNYLINKALLEPLLIGTERADSIFANRLNAILPDFKNLKLNEIDVKEQTWGSFDITPNHKIGIGDSWNPNNYTIDTNKSYLIKEDSIISNSIMYYGTKENDKVRAVTFEWEYEKDFKIPISDKLVKKSFDSKNEFLIDCIIQNVEKQTKRIDKNDDKITWETPTGLILELYYDTRYYSISLVIYQN